MPVAPRTERGATVGRAVSSAARRGDEWRSRRRLGPLVAGRWPIVRGRPIVTVEDARAGDSFHVLSVERRTLLQGVGRMRFGDGVFLNSGVRIDCWRQVEIGDRVLVGQDVLIADTDVHGIGGLGARVEPVIVGRGSWIGARATVLPGVVVGELSIVGAGAVVSRDVPSRVVVAGNPARVIRELELEAAAATAWS